MPTFAISLIKIIFSFENKRETIKNITLNVPEGAIYGFLGPNGAGKSTTIRLIVGLLKANSGQIKIFDQELAGNVDIFNRIGTLIEMPSLYEHLTAAQNLEITCLLRNIPKTKINEVLTTVKLQDKANVLVRKYSLGMKQRLGIALTLVSDPDLLILDEPTNGLDPHGIVEIRELLLELKQKHHKTIFVSSHNLAEIEKIADHVGIISKGKMVFEGTIDALQKLINSDNKVYIETDNPQKAFDLFASTDNVPIFEQSTLIFSCRDKSEISSIVKKMVDNNLSVFGVSNQKSSLEELFIDLIGE